MSQDPMPKSVTISVSRDSVINAVLGLQLVLLAVFGWQLYSIKSQLAEGNQPKVLTQVQAQQPGTGDTGSQPSQPANIVVTTADHIKGGANAKVTIVEYSDFQCPYCEAVFPTIKQIMTTYGDDVRLVYRHFPLSFHPYAQKAAEASECAADQGKFWEYHDLVFGNQALLSGQSDQLKKWAAELRLNTSKFNTCLDSGSKAAIVKQNADSGTAVGVSGTPAFYINGISLVGAQPFSSFQQVIDEQLNKA